MAQGNSDSECSDIHKQIVHFHQYLATTFKKDSWAQIKLVASTLFPLAWIVYWHHSPPSQLEKLVSFCEGKVLLKGSRILGVYHYC